LRRAEEELLWGKLIQSRTSTPARPIDLGPGLSLDLSMPCIVIGGRNGSGKSRLLRSLATVLDDKGLFIDLHHLCEQALIILRSRDDFDEMSEEFDEVGPSDDRFDDVRRVVGRDYDSIQWYALEVEPSDEIVARRFRWSGEQSLLPYFRAQYRGHTYTSRDMGLGEFSVHFLFWILELYKDATDITLLLDEPDAFLPPVGVSSLLSRLLHWCLVRQWQLVMTTHSEEMIAAAVERQAFTLLRLELDGTTAAVHSTDEPRAARSLLSRPPVETILFCEDESAYYLARALIEAADPMLADVTSVVWGNGSGYLYKLRDYLPWHERPDIRFGFVFDGDQRDRVGQHPSGWPTLLLPTASDPDALLKALESKPEELALRLGVTEENLRGFLDGLEGDNPHDWVNALGVEYGRGHALTVLASLWVAENPDGLADFAGQIGASA
jgi:energy-coupling factor transporter ATP-binding protein EcfA2